MAEKSSKAFSPAGISSFFEICDARPDGTLITDFERVGSRGGGFAIEKGVKTEVLVEEADANSIEVFINERKAPEAETSKTVAKMLLDKAEQPHKVMIKHKIEVPVGAGLGSSAAGALTTALALSKALDINLTCNQLGRLAHIAEVKCKTGLGTVGPLMLGGGCALTVEPGAPGIALIDGIPISRDYVVVCGVFGAIPTKHVLTSPEKRLAVNQWGRKTLEKILANPSLENFLACCREFAERTGFVTQRVHALMRLADEADAIGAAQNMVGEAVHALTTLENAERVVQAFKQVLPNKSILVARVATQGARLTG